MAGLETYNRIAWYDEPEAAGLHGIVPDVVSTVDRDCSNAVIPFTRFFIDNKDNDAVGAAFYTCYQDCYADAIKNYISRDSHHELYVFGTAITCNQFRQKLGDGNRIHYLALDMDHLYLFANDRPKDLPEETWKTCVGNVCNRFNPSGKEVIGFRTGNDLFRMNRTERPVHILLVRLGKSNSTPGSCMYSFRVFELNKYAKDPKFTMLYTGNFVFDQEVEVSLNELVEENGARFSLVYYDNTCEVYDGGAAEEAEEPGIGIIHHSTREQLAAFKDAIDYEHFGCFYDPPKEEGYIEDFNDYN